MDNEWGFDAETNGGAHPSNGSPDERVVPADGDPEVPYYQATLHQQERPFVHARMFRMGGSLGSPRRHVLRRWLIVAAIVALGLLFIKPLAVVAAILVALVVGFVLIALLAAGALVMVARFLLGRYPYQNDRWRSGRMFTHRGGMGSHWYV